MKKIQILSLFCLMAYSCTSLHGAASSSSAAADDNTSLNDTALRILHITATDVGSWLNAKRAHDILGVPQGAPAAAIKKNWHKLSLQFHPDRYKGAQRELLIKIINLANNYLKEQTNFRKTTQNNATFDSLSNQAKEVMKSLPKELRQKAARLAREPQAAGQGASGSDAAARRRKAEEEARRAAEARRAREAREAAQRAEAARKAAQAQEAARRAAEEEDARRRAAAQREATRRAAEAREAAQRAEEARQAEARRAQEARERQAAAQASETAQRATQATRVTLTDSDLKRLLNRAVSNYKRVKNAGISAGDLRQINVLADQGNAKAQQIRGILALPGAKK